jgi:chromosome segregation ATPase
VAEERELREAAELKHAQLKTEHEDRLSELASTSRKLKDAEELAQKHAEEARTHKAAVLSGLDRVSARDLDDDDVNDERVAVLRQQLDIANDMARQHKSSADAAADRLRRAEERIAGLEAYHEQTTRESLSLRKQLQNAMKEVQAAQSERAAMQQQLERNQLEGNALEVQLRTLKNLLEERGVSTANIRQSRVLDSPGSRYGTPEMSRVRELERQLDESMRAHEEVRSSFEQREQELNREWEEKLVSLENDREGAMKYVRGLEKMLAKMKQELQKAKTANLELEKAFKEKANVASSNGDSAGWEAERETLRNEMMEQQQSIKTTMSALEAQVATLKTTLSQAEKDRDAARKAADESQQQHETRMNQLAERSKADLEALRRENSLLEERANDAEKKVQLFLDQFETSVDNYRRQSRLEQQNSGPNGISRHGHKDSVSGDSVYSTITDTEDVETDNSGELTPSAHNFPTAGFAGGVSSPDKDKSGHGRDRSSTALDSLATELDALRSHWEETSKKNYRLSDKFEFEKPSPAGLGLSTSPELGSAGLSDWRKKMDLSIRSNGSDIDKGKENQSPKIGGDKKTPSPVAGTSTS